ncbi:MAG: ImmA/IrrE family metallo-endopeptidase [Rhodospirillales bacterium]|nr:ImmA/IrrE family metallo-endopeptidase [Rhodospirillales bacterium]
MPPLGRAIIQNTAEKIAVEAGYTALPVCPKTIAEKHDILVQAKPDAAKGCSGMLVRNGEQFGILYATHIRSEGFQRFSIAHELGHYFLPGHPEAVLKNGIHQSQAGFVARDRYEQEADVFAASLLMPADLFKGAMRKAGDGLEGIIALATAANTSLTATAFRFAELTKDAVAVVISEGGTIVSCGYSEKIKNLAGRGAMPWLYGKPVPTDTLTARFNAAPGRVAAADREESALYMTDWFGLGDGVRGSEEVIGLGGYGRTLTVIRGNLRTDDDFDPEDEADDDEYLADRWTPRFRR